MFSCKFGAYFQNTFFKQHLGTAASTLATSFSLDALYLMDVKGNAQFVQKVTFEPLMDFKQKPLWKLAKAATFKSFLHISYKNTQLLL